VVQTKKQIAEYKKQYGENNKEKIFKYKTQYREDNKEKISEYGKQYYLGHKEQIAEKNRQYNINNKKQLARKKRQYYLKNPNISTNSRARRLKIIGSSEISTAEWKDIMELCDWRCIYCGVPLTKINRSVDHILPLSKGGQHNKRNLVPVCRLCNSSKNDKFLYDWPFFKLLPPKRQVEIIKIISLI